MSNQASKKLPTLRDSSSSEQLDIFQREVREILRRLWEQAGQAVDSGECSCDVFTSSNDGLVPAPGVSTGYLKQDGTWDTPTGTVTLPIAESDVTNLVTDLAAKAPTSRTISTTSPLSGGGDLSSNRTLTVATNSTSSSGVVTQAPNDTTKFWRGDASWATPSGLGFSFSGASAYNSSTISLLNTTHTALTYDTELFDTSSYHSTSSNTSRFVAPATGYYFIRVGCAFSNNTSGDRQITLRKNAAGSGSGGTAMARTTSRPFSGGGAQYMELVTVLQLTSGDYVEAFAWQNSTSTLTTTAGEEAGTFVMVQLGT